ncbi:unnamed protein product [Meloidogyne enterolobii]|uniref:Uncharacterized protein n=1 Tax=Meloidogyne enterolobii TaxID=390850 RepID=A0ACB0YL09_MELEN
MQAAAKAVGQLVQQAMAGRKCPSPVLVKFAVASLAGVLRVERDRKTAVVLAVEVQAVGNLPRRTGSMLLLKRHQRRICLISR